MQSGARVTPRHLRQARYHGFIGVGGIGTGMMFALDGDRTLGRDESRPARLLDSRDYCKLHIIAHCVAVLMDAWRAGFHVLPVGRVGRDSRGRELLDEMAHVGIDTRSVGVTGDRPTTLSVCFQYPDGSGGNITASNSASDAVTVDDVEEAAALLLYPASDYVAVAAPEVSLETRFHFLRRARHWGCLTAASFASAETVAALASGVLECVDLLAMNHDELEAFIGQSAEPEAPEPALVRCAKILTSFQPAIRIVVTMGAHGAFAFDAGSWQHCPALPISPVSTAGAGDALLAAVTCALAVGAPLIGTRLNRQSLGDGPIDSALEFGLLVASLKTMSRHTINPELNVDSVLEFAARHGVELGGALADAIQPPVEPGSAEINYARDGI